MVPRPHSIFSLGEECGKETRKGRTPPIREPGSLPETSMSLVGLRILIERSWQDSNIVFNPKFRSTTPVNRSHQPPTGLPELSFLKKCFLCKQELSPQDDVYMYRGDQGFCSVDCRCRQILLDERREIEASVRERQAAHPRRRRESDRRRRIECSGVEIHQNRP